MKYIKLFLPYIFFISIALVLSWFTHTNEAILQIFTQSKESIYLVIALLFIVGYGLNLFAPKTIIPSFVWAIFFGMALQPTMTILTSELDILVIIVELLAALVLFSGGIDVPFRNFKKYFGPIASLSFLGTILTIFLFSISLEYLGGIFGTDIPAISFLIIGAILASIDPTAIIPSLKSLPLKKPFLRDLAISESAVNDVAGTILTRFFLVALLAVAGGTTVFNLFSESFNRDTFDALALEILWGILVGIIGAIILQNWSKKIAEKKQLRSDPALFISVPILAFAIGSLVGGSGFLAAFVAGLLFDAKMPSHEVRHFFDIFVDRFIKPIIFILLGAIVPIPTLIATALFGIVAAIIFMFIIRPLVVFISLSPWSYKKNDIFSWRELLFLSFIRETGAIPDPYPKK